MESICLSYPWRRSRSWKWYHQISCASCNLHGSMPCTCHPETHSWRWSRMQDVQGSSLAHSSDSGQRRAQRHLSTHCEDWLTASLLNTGLHDFLLGFLPVHPPGVLPDHPCSPWPPTCVLPDHLPVFSLTTYLCSPWPPTCVLPDHHVLPDHPPVFLDHLSMFSLTTHLFSLTTHLCSAWPPTWILPDVPPVFSLTTLLFSPTIHLCPPWPPTHVLPDHPPMFSLTTHMCSPWLPTCVVLDLPPVFSLTTHLHSSWPPTCVLPDLPPGLLPDHLPLFSLTTHLAFSWSSSSWECQFCLCLGPLWSCAGLFPTRQSWWSAVPHCCNNNSEHALKEHEKVSRKIWIKPNIPLRQIS